MSHETHHVDAGPAISRDLALATWGLFVGLALLLLAGGLFLIWKATGEIHEMYEDHGRPQSGAAAVRWVRANIGQYGGDGDTILLAGHSAGAYIAAMLATDPRWLGEDREALAGMVGLAGPYDFAPFDTDSTIAAFGQWPDAPDTQPVTFADAEAPPMLLLTGVDDTTVKPRNSEALAARLREVGVEAELVEYEGVDHIDIVIALARPLRSRAPVLEDLTTFAKRVTNGR